MLLVAALALARPALPGAPEARMSGAVAEAWRASVAGGPPRRVVVVVDSSEAAAPLAEFGKIEEQNGRLVQMLVPPDRLGSLAVAEGVALVRDPWKPEAKEGGSPGAIVTEGCGATLRTDWHANGAVTGEGVRVGIVDVGFDGYEDLLGSELPNEVESDFSRGAVSSSDHGTAVAEVIHDFAPDAELVLATFGTEVEFGLALQSMLDADVDVVNASVGFDNVWAADGTSDPSRYADAAVAAGVIYAGAAGNESKRYRVAPLSYASGTSYVNLGDHYAILVNAPNGRVKVSFRWSEPFGAAKQDLDLVVFDAATQRECGRSESPQGGAGDPFEEVEASDCGESAYAAVYSQAGADLSGLTGYLYSPYGLDETEWTGTQTLTLPADCFDCLAVGAYHFTGGNGVEDTLADYSSVGPTNDGRIKPDFVGPTDVSTASLGPLAFEGSSAASPHLAGLAALWVQATQDRGEPARFEAWARDGARDLGARGPDNLYGEGAVEASEIPPVDCGCSTGAGRPAEGSPVAAAAGLGLGACLRRRRW